MRTHRGTRFLSVLMALLMLVSLMPTTAFAAEVETSTWEKVAFADITASDTVAITMTNSSGTWALPTAGNGGNGQPLAVTAAVNGTSLSIDGSKAGFGWTVSANADGSYAIRNAAGESLYVIANNNGVRVGKTEAAWRLSAEQYLTANDTAATPALRYIGVYNNTDWRCYTSIHNNIKNQTLEFWKYTGSSSGEQEITITPIADAKAVSTGSFSVKGVVTMIDGRNVYVQDATGGIDLYLTAAPSDLVLGDTVIGTGTRADFKGLPELSNATYTKDEGMTLSAKETTLGALTNADLCTYITIKGLEVLAVDASNITVQDASGASINIYKPVLGDKTVQAGDKLDFTGALGIYTNYQLRNTVPSEISLQADPYADIAKDLSVYELTDTLTAGDRILVVNPANSKTLTTAPAATYYLDGADVAPQDLNGTKVIGLDNDIAEWTVAVNDNGTYGLTQGENTLAGNREEYTDSNGKTKVRMNITLVATDSADWKLVDFGESGVFLVNAGLQSGKEGGNVSLEWFNNRFCLYDVYPGNEAKNSDACAVTFYKLVREKVVPTVETPTALPEAGAVEANTEVTFSCATEGAVISYSTDNGETWTEGTSFTVTEAVTLLVKAVKDDVESEAAAFAYTIKEPEPTYNTIAEALAGENGKSFTVKGVVTLVDGKNIYVQDATGGICLYFSTAPTDIALGDTVIGNGTKAVYKGLPELSGATYTKSEGMTLKAKDTTIGALTNDDLCTYIKIKGLEVTAIDGNSYTLKDAKEDTITLYKPVLGDTVLAVGDKIDFTGALGIYNDRQLRNTLASEITPAVEAKVGFVTDLADLTDGAKVVILNPANKMALSQTYAGNYNSGVSVTVADNNVTGFGATEVWTVGVNADGTYTFSTAEGKKLSMGASYSSMPLDDANPNWTVTAVEGSENGFFIDNTGRTGYRMEWYADKNYWSAYYKNNTGDLFIQQFWLVGDEIPVTPSGELNDGDKVVIYNASAEGVLGADDSGLNTSLSNIAATIENGKALPANGAYVFTVGKDGDNYSFQAGGKYLATNNAENLFMSEELLDTGDNCGWWTLEAKGDGYVINSKTARYNNSGVVCIEFFGGAFSGWTFKAADQAIFIFSFYPLDESITTLNDVTNVQKVVFNTTDNPVKQAEYTVQFQLDDVTPLEQLTVTASLNGEPVTNLENNGKEFSFAVPAEITAVEDALNVSVQVQPAGGEAYSGEISLPVQDIPFFNNFLPEPGSKTGDDLMPLISVEVKNASDSDQATITIAGETYPVQIQNGVISFQPTEELKEGRTTVKVVVERADGVTGEKSWSFTVGEGGERLYFGQLHSHTAEYSDGAGTLSEGLNYVKNLPESANVQFVAFTDHSNYFDASGAANPEDALYDMSKATDASQTKWAAYRKTVADFNDSQSDVIALAGFEMTWSGGPGHINTFNSPGIVSRNNTTLNNKTDDAGMKAYYALLDREEGAGTISQFNHPGKTFGNFKDFNYWNAVTDSRFFLVEVGNGEGQIGAGGYYPSYEQYVMALDKGWHVAPTNNQDNHKGRWGNANDARDVILTDDFSEQGIYDALRAMRVYATEDKNLELYYTVNGMQLGSTISEVPEQLELNVQVSDPDKTDSIAKVEVVVNSGKTLHSFSAAEINSGSMSVTLDPEYSYYFIRVTEGDGDLAVTAPVWVGETLKLGISAFECGTSTPVTGEKLTLTTTIFNSEATPAAVKSVTYTTSGGVVIEPDPEPDTEPDTTEYTVPASGTLEIPFKYTPDKAKLMTITATVVLEQGGKEFTFTKDIELDVQDASKLVYIGIDASHYNEYVAGNYKDSMGNFGALAGEHGVRTVELKTSEDLIAACSNEKYAGLIFTAPSRRLAAAQTDPRTYSAEEIAAIKAFNEAGGMVIVSGWGDAYENYSVITDNADVKHMAETQNELLAALGSSIRLGDDEVVDPKLNGGQEQRLYFSTYNFDSYLLEGVDYDAEHPNDKLYTELYSNYGGCSVYFTESSVPASVTPVVFGHATTNIANKDNDSNPQGVKYPYADGDDRVVVMATEQLDGKGEIIVSGAAFMSNFEVQATIEDTAAEKNYSNYKICENLVKGFNELEVSPIAEVRAQTEDGYKYVIEGTVTSNASGYDKDTAFFDCIYVQDETAGICCFPVAGNFKLGDKVRVTGYTDFYQGEPELQVKSITLIAEGDPLAPTEVPAAAISDRSAEGMLVTVKGVVEDVQLENGLIQTIMVKDENGDLCRVFIDGYITTAEDVKDCVVGAEISATGLASYDDTFNAPEGPFPRIRVRNRADIVCTASAELRIVTQPSDVTVAYGENASFTVVAEGDGLTYQWYYRKANSANWHASTAKCATTDTMTIKMTDDRNGQSYRCKVMDKYGNEVTSVAVFMNGEAPAVPVAITQQPIGAMAPVGEIALLDVRAEGVGLRYQWQYRTSSGSGWNDSTQEGATTDTIEVEVTNDRNGQMYRCVVTDISGARVISDAVAIHVEGGVNILEHPRDASGGEGDIVMMSVIAEGDSLHYQWQYTHPGWGKWYNSTQDGAKTDTLVVPVTAKYNRHKYRCVVTDANGVVEYSNVAVLTMTSSATFVTQPQNTTADLGETAVFTAEAQGDIMRYQWQYQLAGSTMWNNSTMEGADTTELKIPATMERNGQKYRCVAIEPNGSRVISEVATLTVVYKEAP